MGPPGTGKTFSAKVCANYLGFPLISIGVDLVKAGGASYLKRILQRIDAVNGAIAYFDEFDKFFADNDKSTKEVLGVLLTWLQEKTSLTFVIATLNRFDSLPVELTRAGRFDKIWYVDFPTAIERKQIFEIHLNRFDKRYRLSTGNIKVEHNVSKIFVEGNHFSQLSASYSKPPTQEDSPLTQKEWQFLLRETQYFTGAEIQNLVEDAARNCFYAQKDHIAYSDLLAVKGRMTALFVRNPEPILAMQNRAKKFAESASSPDRSIFAPPETTLWGEKISG